MWCSCLKSYFVTNTNWLVIELCPTQFKTKMRFCYFKINNIIFWNHSVAHTYCTNVYLVFKCKNNCCKIPWRVLLYTNLIFISNFKWFFYPHLFELQSKLVSWCRNICCRTCSKVPGRQQFFDLFSKRFLEQKIKLKIIINLLYWSRKLLEVCVRVCVHACVSAVSRVFKKLKRERKKKTDTRPATTKSRIHKHLFPQLKQLYCDRSKHSWT